MPKTKKNTDLSRDNLVSSLLSKNKKTKISSQKYEPPPQKPKKQVSFSSPNTQIINNFHKAINSLTPLNYFEVHFIVIG